MSEEFFSRIYILKWFCVCVLDPAARSVGAPAAQAGPAPGELRERGRSEGGPVAAAAHDGGGEAQDLKDARRDADRKQQHQGGDGGCKV